jgi:NADH-quinone oxidoreductase subunit G
VEVPLVRDGQRLVPSDWETALSRLAQLANAGKGRVVLLASGRASLESLAWVRRLVEGREVIAAIKVPEGGEATLPGIPNLALRKERAPNLDGARLAGYSVSWTDALAKVEGAGLVILLDADLDEPEASRLASAGTVVALSSVDDDRLKGAALLLPVTTMAEENGTYINRDARVQRFMEAKAAPGMARPAWWVASNAWAENGSGQRAPATAAEAFARLSEVIPALGGLTYADLGLTGRVLEAGSTAPSRAAGQGAAR